MATKTLTRSMTYAQLVTAIGAGTLNKGESITITDFATVHYMLDGSDVWLDSESNPEINTGITEPLTVLALSANTISHEAKSTLYPQDIIHYDWNPDNWIYDIGFAGWDEAVLTGFKGVIYFRHDTKNNNAVHNDFRNIKYRRWKPDVPTYNEEATYQKGDVVIIAQTIKMFHGDEHPLESQWINLLETFPYYYIMYSSSGFDNGNIAISSVEYDYIDCTMFMLANELDSYDLYCKNNIFAKNATTDDIHYLNQSILTNTVIYISFGFLDNIFNGVCCNNTFLGYSYNNRFSSVYDNLFGTDLYGNEFGAELFSNIIGTSQKYNTIGNNCQYNVLGSGGYGNQLGNELFDNIIGNTFTLNSVFGDLFRCSIGQGVNNNCFANSFSYADIKGQYGLVSFKNNTIKNYVMGTSENRLNFNTATHVFEDYNCEIFSRQDGTIRLRYVDNNDADVVVAYNA